MSRNWIAIRESRLDREPSSKAHLQCITGGGEVPKRDPHTYSAVGQYKTVCFVRDVSSQCWTEPELKRAASEDEAIHVYYIRFDIYFYL